MEKMQHVQNEDKKQEVVLFRLSGVGLAWYILPFPSVGFIICVFLSILYNFEESTSTHCRVPNYLPSISAAIGGAVPQRYIWRIFIALHCAPRLMLAICYYNYYRTFHVRHNRGLYSLLARLVALLHIVENLCLVGLTNVSSNEDFAIHKLCFIGFIVFSQIYMILSVLMFKWAHAELGMDESETKSYRWKFNLMVLNISVFILAMYVYWRHNTYCEPGMYTWYALCEYVIVASNIAFHGTGVMEFGEDKFGCVRYRRKSQDSKHKNL